MEVNHIKETTLAVDRGLVPDSVVATKLLSDTPPSLHTPAQTHTQKHTLFKNRVKSLFLDFWLVDRPGFERGHLIVSSLEPHYSAKDLWYILHSPICIKVLLIALISSDDWWLLLNWIFTINAFFLFILHNATLHVACYYTARETISSQ